MSPRRLFALIIVLLTGCSRSPQHEFEQGLDYYKAEQYSKAEACFERAIAGTAPTAQALNFLAVCQLQEGKTDAAIQNLQESLKLDPRHAAARYNLGLAMQEREQRESPTPKAKPAIIAPPKPVEPPKLVEPVKPVEPVKLVEQPKPAEPVKPPPVVEQAPPPKIETPAPAPKRRPVLAQPTLKAGNRAKAKVLFNEGITLQQQGKLAAAVSSYGKSIAADPSYAQAYYNLAIAYRDARQPERALDNYEMALLANPQFSDARFNYAILLQQEGYTIDALAQYEKILQDNPSEASVHLTVATLYSKGRETRDKARQHYQAFLKLSPNSPLARDIRRWLDQNP